MEGQVGGEAQGVADQKNSIICIIHSTSLENPFKLANPVRIKNEWISELTGWKSRSADLLTLWP
jgi:hypothetical protein